MNDLVAEGACGISFNTAGVGGRNQYDFWLELFDELYTWLETELERSWFKLEQIQPKMITIDKFPNKSIVYSKQHLQNMLVDRYQDKM